MRMKETPIIRGFRVELAKRRMERHIDTQLELADITGIDANHLSRIERGLLLPDLVTATKIAKGLGCDIWDIWVPDDEDSTNQNPDKPDDHLRC